MSSCSSSTNHLYLCCTVACLQKTQTGHPAARLPNDPVDLRRCYPKLYHLNFRLLTSSRFVWKRIFLIYKLRAVIYILIIYHTDHFSPLLERHFETGNAPIDCVGSCCYRDLHSLCLQLPALYLITLLFVPFVIIKLKIRIRRQD